MKCHLFLTTPYALIGSSFMYSYVLICNIYVFKIKVYKLPCSSTHFHDLVPYNSELIYLSYRKFC